MLDKFKYTDKEIDELINSMVILVDTREKVNSHIIEYFDRQKIKWMSRALSYGDYSFMIPKNDKLNIPRDLYFDKEIIIERKANLSEFVGNLSSDRARIEKELALSPKNKIIIIEESTYDDIVKGSYNSKYNKKSVWATMFSWWHKYNCPIVFLNKGNTGSYMKGFFIYFLKNEIR